MDEYIVRDGDIILTDDGFIFYAIGYEHPKEKVISYLKYIPQEFKSKFPLSFINNVWYHDNLPYIRPKQLYSPNNFKIILESFKKYFPDYLFYSDRIQKVIFVIPYNKIKRVFIPKIGLKKLLEKEDKDELEQFAIKLIDFLSSQSGVPMNEFGIHGSLLTSMHSKKSDVDVAVYDQKNYFKVKKAVKKLNEDGKVKYLFEIESDKWRFNKCEYLGRKFVFNAIRKIKQVVNAYAYIKYKPLYLVKGEATIIDNSEAAYRPAIYKIKDFKCLSKDLLSGKTPSEVISMVGEFRDVAKKGQRIQFHGMLEKTVNTKLSETYYRIFIGSENAGEFLRPI
ncbi:MAG: hypothetical protein ACTSVY_11960 [Candidatus Helarchaeota archaeon]